MPFFSYYFTCLLSNFFCTMTIVLMEEARLVVVMNNLDLKIQNVVFEAKCSIGMTLSIELQINSWKICS